MTFFDYARQQFSEFTFLIFVSSFTCLFYSTWVFVRFFSRIGCSLAFGRKLVLWCLSFDRRGLYRRAVSIICLRLHVPGSNLWVAFSFFIFLLRHRRVSHRTSPLSVRMFINGNLSFGCATVFCYRVDTTLWHHLAVY
jgi:hypothetical protein